MSVRCASETSQLVVVRSRVIPYRQACHCGVMSDRKDAKPGHSSPQSKLQQYAKSILWFLVDQWFLVALGIVIVIASQVQVPASHQAKKEVIVSYLAVSVIFFITGCTLPSRVLLHNYSRWKVHLFAQVQCFLMTSATEFAIVSICATNPHFMDPGLLVGMIFCGCVSTTIASNVAMTKQAHGNSVMTVVQSTIGNFLGPFLTPVLVEMYLSTNAWYTDFLPKERGGYAAIYRRVFKQLGLSIFLPIFVGQIVQNVFPKQTKKVFVEWRVGKLGSLALVTIIWSSYDQAFQSGAFASVKNDNLIFIVFISVALFLLWLAVSLLTSVLWLDKDNVIAMAFTIPAKSPAIGVPLTQTLFAGLSTIDKSKIQIPLVIFQGLQIGFSSLLTVPFRKWIGSADEDNLAKHLAEEELKQSAANVEETP